MQRERMFVTYRGSDVHWRWCDLAWFVAICGPESIRRRTRPS